MSGWLLRYWEQSELGSTGNKAPNPLGGINHHANGQRPKPNHVPCAELSKELSQHKEDNASENRAFETAYAADYDHENHEHRPVIHTESRLWRDS